MLDGWSGKLFRGRANYLHWPPGIFFKKLKVVYKMINQKPFYNKAYKIISDIQEKKPYYNKQCFNHAVELMRRQLDAEEKARKTIENCDAYINQLMNFIVHSGFTYQEALETIKKEVPYCYSIAQLK